MSTLNYLTKTLSTFKNIRTKRNIPPPKNELIHPRFGIAEKDSNDEKNGSDSLLFLMYSKENETLFI